MNTNDLALLDRWRRQRDAEAFRELVARHAGMVYGTCCRILGNATDAEDVAQDCFLQLAQRPLRPKRSVGGWLHALATHRALDRMKAESRRRAREERFGNTPEPQRERESLSDHVDEALAELDEMQRSLLVLHFFEGHSHDDIARGLDVSRSTVTRRITDGVEQVRTRLRAKGVAVPAAALAAALLELKAEALPATLASALGKVAIAGRGAAASVISASIVLKVVAAAVAVVMAVGGAVVVWQAPEALPVQIQAAVVDSPATDHATATPEAVATPKRSVDEPPVLDAALTPPEPRIEQASSPSPTTGALVEGVVLDLQGKPVADARVECYGAGAGFRGSTQIFTDENGRFHYNDVPPADSFQVYASTDDPTRRTNQQVLEKIVAGETYDLILTLHEAAVSGRVIDASGRPVRDAEVMAQPVKQVSHGIPMGHTDAAGHYTVTGLAEGEYVLKANWPGGRTAWPADGTHVTLSPDEARGGFTLVLGEPAGLTISGRITDLSGNGLYDIHIQTVLGKPTPTYTWTRTDADGYYTLAGLEDGTYSLQLSHPKYATLYEGEIVTGTEDANFSLAARGSIAASVVDATTGLPIREFEVLERKPISDVHHHMLTEGYRNVSDAQGQFVMEDVDPGATPVHIRADGYSDAIETVDVPAGTVVEARISMERGLRVHGTIVNSAGEPIVGALVFSGKLPPGNLEHEYDAERSNDSGEFALANFKSSETLITCYHPRYAPAFATLPTRRDDPVVVLMDEGLEVRGKVLVNGVPAGDAGIGIHFPEWANGTLHRVSTSPDGTYAMDFVPRMEGLLEVSVGGDSEQHMYASQPFMPVSSGRTMALDVDIKAGTGAVEGIIYEEQKPRGGLYMVLEMEPQGGWNLGFSGHAVVGDGTYRFDNVPAGNGIVRVYPMGAPQERDPVEIPVVVREGEVATCDVEVPVE